MNARRKFLKGLAIAPMVARAWWAEAASESRLLFVGTQTVKGSSKGIYAYSWDAANGELKQLGLAAATDNPTFLALSPNRKYLYAANEMQNGNVSAFAVDAAGAKLTPINVVSAGGSGTCHVITDHTGQAVFCANYSSGSASSFHVEAGGKLSDAVSHFQYSGHGPDASRQEAPHAHRVTVSPENRFLLVNDLGLDCIHVYKLDAATAKLVPNDPPQWNAAPGAGPRALRFHPNDKWAYCVLEMASEVEVLAWDDHKGTLTSLQKNSLVPEGYKGDHTGAEIVFDRDGHFAYAADRFDNVIVSFKIDTETGKLTLLGHTAYGGKTPRHIALDPSGHWLLIANQDSDTISVRSRDAKTGLIAETGKDFDLSKPQCLVFL